jgi:hypothetical protein
MPARVSAAPLGLVLNDPVIQRQDQLRLSASGMRGTYMMTGLQPVFLRLTTPNCKQLQTGSVKPTMLVWRMYDKYMSSLTL